MSLSFANSLKENSVSIISYLQTSGYVCATLLDLNVFESLFLNIFYGRRNSVKVLFYFDLDPGDSRAGIIIARNIPV